MVELVLKKTWFNIWGKMQLLHIMNMRKIVHQHIYWILMIHFGVGMKKC